MSDLLLQLLHEQQHLTAVERFSQQHVNEELPAQQKHYSRLLPATPPAEGQQYAFNVDLDQCSGCKACVTACHNLNGLDDDEAWRDVGLLIGGTAELPIMQHVTTACHHCLEPACATACPVNAYEKNPVTGIVKHLDDQCFGCQYCTLACPYDVPKYNADKGIVRKCDLCSDRLAVGEAPACVQACPHEAISVAVVNVSEVAAVEELVSTAPKSDFTRPTTRYSGRHPTLANLAAADEAALRPQHAHWPLVIMLVLTQMSVGMFIFTLIFPSAVRSVVALLTGLLALGASTCHLGRPQYAFRAFIGLRHSWLSREIVAFGGFAAAAMAYTVLQWVPVASAWGTETAGWATAGSGLLGIYCSVMIYVFTRREFWSFTQTATKFFLTIVILGTAGSWTAMGTSELILPTLPAMLLTASLIKLGFEVVNLRQRRTGLKTQMGRSALLMTGPLGKVMAARFALGIFGGVILPCAALFGHSFGMLSFTSLITCLCGEFAERYVFFAAVSPDRMPGGLQV
ncbi:MAG: DmsC/YnfH family molybdoenzyme membrane anchor subunit [Planctomycetaceae bacterium]